MTRVAGERNERRLISLEVVDINGRIRVESCAVVGYSLLSVSPPWATTSLKQSQAVPTFTLVKNSSPPKAIHIISGLFQTSSFPPYSNQHYGYPSS